MVVEADTHVPSESCSIDCSLAGLRAAFDSGKTRPLAWRQQQLQGLRAMVTDKEKEILEALATDLGKCALESVVTETAFVRGEADYALRNVARWMKPTRVATPLVVKPAKARLRPEPLGVVLVIGPWNYPVQLVLAPLVGALAAGNCAVVKPSELTPSVSSALAGWLQGYVDEDCVTVVQGDAAAAQTLLRQRFDHIFYTGGGRVGRLVMEAAATHLTPVTLELGGKSPCLVSRDADLDVAARRIAWGKLVNAGQTCVAPDYVLVDRGVESAFVDKLKSAIVAFYGVDPKKSPDYGRVVNAGHVQRLAGLLDGCTVYHGGEVDVAARYVAPTLLIDVSPEAPVMQDEIFGPILPVIGVDSMSEAIAFVNGRPKPLALYVFTRSRATADAVLQQTSSGSACVNDVVMHLGVRELPFGGVGDSGMGAYHGRYGFDTFTHRKPLFENKTWIDPSLRYPPYSAKKLSWLRRLLG